MGNREMKKFWLLGGLLTVALTMTGCGRSEPMAPAEIANRQEENLKESSEDTAWVKHAAGFEDCIYRKIETKSRYLYVLRCPNSTTTTNSTVNKSIQSVTTIDGAVVPEGAVATSDIYRAQGEAERAKEVRDQRLRELNERMRELNNQIDKLNRE